MVKFDINWKNMLIQQMNKGRHLTLSARLIGVGQDRISYERKHDPVFNKAVEEAEAVPPEDARF